MQPDFQALQYAFAGHIRNPEKNPIPDAIEDRRMGIYRDLFFNNIESFVAQTFPVLKLLFDENNWLAMIRDFMENHCSHSPFFLDIPKEFMRYLEEEYSGPVQYPFMLELAHYEWVELALDVNEAEVDALPQDFSFEMIPNDQIALSVSPLAWFFEYNYPVHQIGPDAIPDAPSPTHLLIYRNRSDEVRFLQPNPITAQLFAIIQSQPAITFSVLLNKMVALNPSIDKEVLANGMLSQLSEFIEKSIICPKHAI